jgi:hypothetical protein
MKARWAAGDNGACHSDSTRSNGPSLALHALKAVVGQPRNQAAAENDIECGVREFPLSISFYLFLSNHTVNYKIRKRANISLLLKSTSSQQNIHYILIYLYLPAEIHSDGSKFVHYFN